MYQPLVSIVIPFYSEKKWLIEALDSVIKQTYKKIEVLLINDGSPENIDDIIKKYNSIVKVIFKKNGGPASARNLGIEKATGKYIAFLDSDDIWLPEKIERQVKFMEENNYIWSQHSYRMFWEGKDKNKIINTGKYRDNVFIDCLISFKVQTSTVVILRDVLLDNHIKFPINKRYGQDMSFFRELAQTYPLGYLEGVYSLFRIRGANAGFRARVQLNHRSETYSEIKGNSKIIEALPKGVVISYIWSNYFNTKLNRVIKRYNIKSEILIENLSRVFYIIPYIILRMYSIK